MNVSKKFCLLKGAGTDAKVYLIIYGKDGRMTSRVELKETKPGVNSFEKGKTDNFQIRSANVGEIGKINISHDGKGSGAGWFCESIQITNKLNNNKIK